MTAARFRHELARLGKFTGRKSDGKAGWQVLWRGWHQLYLLVQEYHLAIKNVGNVKCFS